MSIQRRLILLILGAATILCVIFAYTYKENYALFNNRLNETGMVATTRIAGAVDQYFEKLKATISNIAQAYGYSYRNGQALTVKQFVPLLKQFYAINKDQGVENLMVGLNTPNLMTDANGRIQPEGYNTRSLPWYQAAVLAGSVAISEPFFRTGISGMTVGISAPFFDVADTLAGVAALTVNTENLSNLLAGQKLWNEGFSFIASKKGTVIASSGTDNLLGENITQESEVVTPSLSAIGADMVNLKSGFGNCMIADQDWRIFYVPTNDDFLLASAFPQQAIDHMVSRFVLEQASVHLGALFLLFLLFVPTILKIKKSADNLFSTSETIRSNLEEMVAREEIAQDIGFSLLKLTHEVDEQAKANDVVEFKRFLSSMSKTLKLISTQYEELTAYAEENLTLNTLLETTNSHLEKRENIWRQTLETTRAISDNTEYDQKARHICETLQVNLQAHGVTLATLQEKDGGNRFHISAQTGFEGCDLDHCPTIAKLLKDVLHTRTLQWTRCPPPGDAGHCIGISKENSTLLAIPLNLLGEVAGVLILCFDEQKVAPESVIETLLPVASTFAGYIATMKNDKEIRNSYHYLINKMQALTGMYHQETEAHLLKVAEYCRMAAKWLGRSQQEQDDIALFSRLHDIGKIRVPREIITKPAPLTPEEWRIMKRHSEWGAEFVGNANWLEMARKICLTHHEKWDGSGYPAGLKGDEIPWEGQVTSLADIYEALRSPRSYKTAMSHEQAVDIILNGDGRTLPNHFSPWIRKLFVDCHSYMNQIYAYNAEDTIFDR